MPNIFKFFTTSGAKDYEFQEVSVQGPVKKEGEEELEPADMEPVASDAEENSEEEPEEEKTVIDYAAIQAEAILEDARKEAEGYLAEAKAQAQIQADILYEEAKEAGRKEGYVQGMAQAQEEGQKKQEEQAARMAEEVQKFLDRAGNLLDRQLDDNLNDLRDLAIAIAEKVISVSLRSSTDVIGRMVQTALDKRKHREWVYIYIAQTDVRHMGQIPASLKAAVSGLSDRVRIIPMADDESGTCVIEMPEEIIDASVSTQINNIRNMLSDVHSDDEAVSFSNITF